jgi:hypothetical protein
MHPTAVRTDAAGVRAGSHLGRGCGSMISDNTLYNLPRCGGTRWPPGWSRSSGGGAAMLSEGYAQRPHAGGHAGAWCRMRKIRNNPMRGHLRWKPPVGLASLGADGSVGLLCPHPCRCTTPPPGQARGQALVRSSRPKPAKSGRGEVECAKPRNDPMRGATREPGAECAKRATTPCAACCVGSRPSGLCRWRRRLGGVALPSPVSLRDTSSPAKSGRGEVAMAVTRNDPMRGCHTGAWCRMRKARNNPMRGLLLWTPPVGLAQLEAKARWGCSSAGPMIADNTSCNLCRCGRRHPHPRRFAPRPRNSIRGQALTRSSRSKPASADEMLFRAARLEPMQQSAGDPAAGHHAPSVETPIVGRRLASSWQHDPRS